MSLVYVLVFGSVVLFGVTAAYGLVWAIRSGQMRDFGRGAASIFDAEEPPGEMTDSFPESTADAPGRETGRSA